MMHRNLQFCIGLNYQLLPNKTFLSIEQIYCILKTSKSTSFILDKSLLIGLIVYFSN